MILYIAEKPSLGRAIADALPRPHQRGEGFIKVGNGDVVSWCIGHLLEQAEPEAYNPAFKKWDHIHLPIIPGQWQLKPKKGTSKQLTVLRKLVKQADQLVHAGDPDREGQLLVDEVIDYLGVKGPKRESVQRCLISDLNLPAVKRSLSNLRSNREFVPLSTSALARSRADWLYGINLTRAYTLQGQKVGYQGVLSVGRVQTPILGLVVRRDEEIANFVSKPFYEVWATLQTEAGERFKAKWSPSDNCARFLDEQGRNLSKPLAENVAGRITGHPATVTRLERKKKKQAAPLPYSLSSLQIDASKAFGLSAQQVLDTCQSLYERQKVITYPRSDSRHLPTEHFAQAGSVVDTIKGNLSALGENRYDAAFPLLNTAVKSKAWNDGKVDAHHAIIPTQKRVTKLNDQEAKVYSLICRNYLAQFLPGFEYFDTRAEITIQAGLFIAKAKEVVQDGWKVLFPRKANAQGQGVNRQNSTEEEPEQILPNLTEGQLLESLNGEVLEKHTTPPKHFTDATLLAAMTGISAFVQDSELKQVLKETDGLGTEATRAGIIELLFKRGFLSRTGKTIKATEAGKGLIHALPDSATLPDMTARWESTLTAISQREARYESLMTPLLTQLTGLVQQSQSVLPQGLAGLSAGKSTKRFSRKKPSRKKRSHKK